MKNLFLSFIILVTVFCTAFGQVNHDDASKISWIGFQWEGDSIGNRYFEKLAMFVPFKMEDIPRSFTMQFDLGAPVTMIYGNSFLPFLKKYPRIADKLDTVHKDFVIQGIKVGAFKNVSFSLDTVKFTRQTVAFFSGFGDSTAENELNGKTPIHVGTVGSNLFKNKILCIDFRHQRLAVLDSLLSSCKSDLIDVIIERGRVKIPVQINGKTVYVLYDTGTSFASLYLSEKDWDQYRDTISRTDTIMATAWGTTYPLLVSKTSVKIKIGNHVFNLETVMANNLKPYHDFYKRENVIGLMGNKLFYDKTVVIDFKHGKFGVIDLPVSDKKKE